MNFIFYIIFFIKFLVVLTQAQEGGHGGGSGMIMGPKQLVSLSYGQCEQEACRCSMENKLQCQPQKNFLDMAFQSVPTPACVQHYGQQGVLEMFTAIKKSSSSKNGDGIKNIFEEFKEQISQGQPQFQVECVKETVQTIRTAIRGIVVSVEIFPNCDFCENSGNRQMGYGGFNGNNARQFQASGGYGHQQGK